jgi:hypothetical protein
MTVLEASSRLLEFFASNEYFELEKDFNKICLISDTDADKASILVALEELAKQNFIVKKEFDKRGYWILFKPLAMHNQEVSINVSLGIEIANILNKILSNEENKCNPLNISEEDIFNLTMIIKKVIPEKEDDSS